MMFQLKKVLAVVFLMLGIVISIGQAEDEQFYIWTPDSVTHPSFRNPSDVAIASNGIMYVTTAVNSVKKLDSSGNLLIEWGGRGNTEGKLDAPAGIAINEANGNVYVVDSENRRIQIFTSNGVFVDEWGREGDENGSFLHPQGIAIDNNNNGIVYVADNSNHRIQKFTSNGEFLDKWGTRGSGDGNLYILMELL